jgi:hypothetical protein
MNQVTLEAVVQLEAALRVEEDHPTYVRLLARKS